MPVIVSEKVNRLRIQIQIGTDPEGNPITRTLAFGNVKTSASHQDIYDVAVLIGGACEYPVLSYTLEEDKDLTE
ncbi:MAG: DUF1659 domain-containing protein [Candidatus Atribacteria bacterium]|nr:DUF1659 domain-containing protein [Candidatus Atribacteria bacterium]